MEPENAKEPKSPEVLNYAALEGDIESGIRSGDAGVFDPHMVIDQIRNGSKQETE